MDIHKSYINYIKFQSLFRWFIHLELGILTGNSLLFVEKGAVGAADVLGKNLYPLFK
jgi:hypothetical protein